MGAQHLPGPRGQFSDTVLAALFALRVVLVRGVLDDAQASDVGRGLTPLEARTGDIVPADGSVAGAALRGVEGAGMADVQVAAALLDLGAATLGESGATPMPARLHPVWRGARLAAPAYPVRCTPGDNLAIHVAVAAAPPGCALVVDVGDVPGRGYWGEVLTTAAEARRLAGLVIDGCVRDLAALEAHRFPVFAAGAALPGASKRSPGTAGVPVEVAGVRVAPGDWVVGDSDGVVVVAADHLDEVLEAGSARAAKEQAIFDKLHDGATTVELLALDPSPVRVQGQASDG